LISIAIERERQLLKGLIHAEATTVDFYPYHFGEAALVASRQVRLAGPGATVVTRDCASEAGVVFKTLVKEGTVVESRAIRFFGDQSERR
jgi:hypothetical protein